MICDLPFAFCVNLLCVFIAISISQSQEKIRVNVNNTLQKFCSLMQILPLFMFTFHALHFSCFLHDEWTFGNLVKTICMRGKENLSFQMFCYDFPSSLKDKSWKICGSTFNLCDKFLLKWPLTQNNTISTSMLIHGIKRQERQPAIVHLINVI